MTDAERLPMILSSEVPYWSEIERMTVRRAPLPAFAPSSPAAHVGIWHEIARAVLPKV